jgi:hypothetical protein
MTEEAYQGVQDALKKRRGYISPNDLQANAIKVMLEGKAPVTERDWQLLINYWAANISVAEADICKLMKRLFDCPISDDDIKQIAEYQVKLKK